MRRALPAVAVAVVVSGAAVPLGSSAAVAAGGPVVVVKGLDNPRQVSWGPNGSLVVAEAGRGGRTCLGTGEDTMCVGPTGAISVVASPATTRGALPSRRITGLMSAAGPTGVFAVGSDGAAKRGTQYYAAITATPPDLPPFPSSAQSGKLLRLAMGTLRQSVDIAAYEMRVNPDGKQKESNPYAVLPLRGSSRVLVADAAANTVVAVDGATVSTWKVFPTAAGQPEFVPTSLTQDDQGFVYVGGLGGEKPGAAKVVKLTPSGRVVKTFTGFTGITGVAVDPKGYLYVSELFGENKAGPPGRIVKVGGTRRWTLNVPFPAGLAVNAAQDVYVAAWSIADRDGAPASGEDPPLPGGALWKVRF